VMFGPGHDQPGILIELKQEHGIDVEDQKQLSELRNRLWSVSTARNFLYVDLYCRPVIEEANKVAPAFSRIFKEMILITSRDKPLPRAGKGTVLRKVSLQSYDSEIEAL